MVECDDGVLLDREAVGGKTNERTIVRLADGAGRPAKVVSPFSAAA